MDLTVSGRSIAADEARRLRLRVQGLLRPAEGVRPAEIVAALCGIQAQDMPGAGLSLWARSRELRPSHLEQAICDRQVVRTWAMRGTLHLLAASDVHWTLALLAPTLTKLSARHAELGLDQQTFTRAISILREALHGGQQRTRAELGAELSAHGVAPDGQRLPHILAHASLQGVICQGPARGTEPTYVLLDEWLPQVQPIDRMESLRFLARRYLAGYGPADLQDFVWWSGLPQPDARTGWQAIESETIAVDIDGRGYTLLASERNEPATGMSAPSPGVRLLPGFDGYVLGYRDRRLMIDPAYTKRVNAGGGMLKPSVVVDGRVVGIWSRAARRSRVTVSVAPFERLASEAVAALQAEVTRLGHFLEQETELEIADSE